MAPTPPKICFFCGREIEGKVSKHHRLPKRYIPKGVDHRKDNIVPSHQECHFKAHRLYDDPRWSRQRFIEEMEPLNFGERIFAGD